MTKHYSVDGRPVCGAFGILSTNDVKEVTCPDCLDIIKHPHCVFCGIVASRSDVLYQDTHAIVIEPLNPVVPGHVIAISKAHVRNATVLPSVTAMTVRALAQYVRNVQSVRETQDWYESYNMITSAGHPATQSVFHLHIHLVPRTFGDGLLLPWSKQKGEQS